MSATRRLENKKKIFLPVSEGVSFGRCRPRADWRTNDSYSSSPQRTSPLENVGHAPTGERKTIFILRWCRRGLWKMSATRRLENKPRSSQPNLLTFLWKMSATRRLENSIEANF